MSLNQEEIVARLNPTHLQSAETDAELKELVTEATEAKDPEKQEEAKRTSDPKAQKSYTFDLGYTDATGKVWTGKFTSEIPTIQIRQQIGVLRAQLSGGAAFESLDPLTAELNLMIAELTFRLSDRPRWAANLRNLLDFGIVQTIYEEVAAHEAFFLGWVQNKGSSKGES